jgi:adenosyl cobinamide kinase/adenosyl cobinamide phosphate guanylyltransferase
MGEDFSDHLAAVFIVLKQVDRIVTNWNVGLDVSVLSEVCSDGFAAHPKAMFQPLVGISTEVGEVVTPVDECTRSFLDIVVGLDPRDVR